MAKERSAAAKLAIEQANAFFATSPDALMSERRTIKDFVVRMLVALDMYQGYNYLYWVEQGFAEWHLAGSPEGEEKKPFLYGPSGDDSRIFLY